MTAPAALFLKSPGCSHCKAMHATLITLVDDGKLSSLKVVDISKQPETAEELGVRSVPWLQLGEFVLEGAHSPGELDQWIKASKQKEGWSQYLAHLLSSGSLSLAERLLNKDPGRLNHLLPLAENPDTEMNIRIGIAAILEGQRGSKAAQALIPNLAKLIKNKNTKIRADAAHYLGLTGSQQALPALESLLDDADSEVREIALESIDDIRNLQIKHN